MGSRHGPMMNRRIWLPAGLAVLAVGL